MRAAIDAGKKNAKPGVRASQVMIERKLRRMAELQKEDTPQNRAAWREEKRDVRVLREWIDWGDYPADVDDPENPPEMLSYLPPDFEHDSYVEPPPPWEESPPIDEVIPEGERTLSDEVVRFLKKFERDAQRNKKSVGRYTLLRSYLGKFVDFHGSGRAVTSVSELDLVAYKEHIDDQIEAGTIRPITGRDRVAAVKQFFNWAYMVRLIAELPRVFLNRELTIEVIPNEIKTFTGVELAALLNAATERMRLYMLMMLNCGYLQGDIAELKHSEVDWKAGRIIRKRSKTGKRGNGRNENVPTVNYLLWPETFDLLKAHRSDHPSLVLVNDTGGPLKLEGLRTDGRGMKNDNIRSAFNRLIRKLANRKIDPIHITKTLTHFRKTCSTKLGEHREYAQFKDLFLGHAPKTMADRHYTKYSQSLFDEAVTWLRSQFLQ